jgi:hypothetical protein
MRKVVVTDVDGATWVPSPAFEAYGVRSERERLGPNYDPSDD